MSSEVVVVQQSVLTVYFGLLFKYNKREREKSVCGGGGRGSKQ